MELGLLEGGSVEEWRQRWSRIVGEGLLEPDLRGAMVLPIGKDADAVAGGEDGIEVMFELVEGEIFVDGLRDLKCGDDIESDAGNDAQSA